MLDKRDDSDKLQQRDVSILEQKLKMYGGKVFGKEVPEHVRKSGYLDYRTLGEIVGDMILNNNLRQLDLGCWDLVNGYEYDDEYGEVYFKEIYQDYIISEHGVDILARYTDEMVFYNEELDIYIWGVTHFGTSWDYVLTDIKLENGDEE